MELVEGRLGLSHPGTAHVRAAGLCPLSCHQPVSGAGGERCCHTVGWGKLVSFLRV